MLRRLVLCLLTLAILQGCGSTDTVDSVDLNEDRIWREYSLTWDADSRRVEAVAQFRVGGSTGTTVRLTEPSQIFVDRERLTVKDGEKRTLNLSGTWYEAELPAQSLPSETSFAWERLDGKILEDPASFGLQPELELSTSKLARGQSLGVAVVGWELDFETSFSCRIEPFFQGGEVAAVNVVNSKNLVFDGRATSQLSPGVHRIVCSLTQRRNIDSKVGDLGGLLRLNYFAHRENIEVLP